MLITFEGIDGSGKSTQIDRLSRWLSDRGETVRTLREPGGTEISEEIREILLHHKGPMDPVTELLLFSAARSELVSDQIRPALSRGELVLLDRFYDSTLAYQGYGRRAARLAEIEALNRMASHGCEPDLTLYLRLTPEEAAGRLSGERDRMEKAGPDFFERVMAGFDSIAHREPRVRTIDATRSAEDVEQMIREEVERRLSARDGS